MTIQHMTLCFGQEIPDETIVSATSCEHVSFLIIIQALEKEAASIELCVQTTKRADVGLMGNVEGFQISDDSIDVSQH